MSDKIVALNGSNSSTSINRQVLDFAISRFPENAVEFYDLNQIQVPIYSIDIEKNDGIPVQIQELASYLSQFKKVLITCPEHNSLMPAFFKNILDWLSRTNVKYFEDSQIILMATSNGGRGGARVLDVLTNVVPYAGGEIVATFGLPHFKDNFQNGKIVDKSIVEDLDKKLSLLN